MDNASYQDVLKTFADSFHRGDKYFRADIKLNAKKGTSWVEAFVKLIYDDAGKFIGTAGILSEINERKHAEEKLVSQNEHLKQSHQANYQRLPNLRQGLHMRSGTR